MHHFLELHNQNICVQLFLFLYALQEQATKPESTLLAKHYTLFFYIRPVVQKGNLMQSLGKHIYLEYKTQLKLEKHTDTHT